MPARRLKDILQGLLARRGHGPDRLPDRGPFEAQRRLLLGHGVRTVFDVGAFGGDVSARYRSLFPDAAIHSFEPAPASYTNLSARFRGDRFVQPWPLAVAERVGSASFYVDRVAATSSLLPWAKEGRRYAPEDAEPVAVEHVVTTTLDAFCGEHDLAGVDILKLDAQGAELAVLRGAEGLLGRRAVKLVYAALAFVPEREGGALFHEVAGLLAGHGYGVYDLYNPVRADNGQLRSAHALFVAPEVRRRAIDDPPL